MKKKNFFQGLWQVICNLLEEAGRAMEKHHKWRMDCIKERGFDPCPDRDDHWSF
jgi:hypothetical protein